MSVGQISNSATRTFWSMRALRTLGHVRHRQLMLAMQGHICESARYADWAKRLRRCIRKRCLHD